MAEGNRLARGSRAAGGHHRIPAVVQPLGDEPAERRCDPRVTAQKTGQPQQHRAAHRLLGQGLPHRGGTPDEYRALQVELVVGRDRPSREIAETGGHAVGRAATGEVLLHRPPALPHVLLQRGAQLHRLALTDHATVVVEVELVVPLEDDHRVNGSAGPCPPRPPRRARRAGARRPGRSWPGRGARTGFAHRRALVRSCCPRRSARARRAGSTR